MAKPSKLKRKANIQPLDSAYNITTITIAGRYRKFLMHRAGECWPGSVQRKGNTGYFGELLKADYDRAVASGEWNAAADRPNV